MNKKKFASISILMIFLLSMIPMPAFAAPEAYAFQDYSKVQNVNPYNGDMVMSLPLFHVPQPGGEAYPLVLNYQAGVKLDQPASWVGLGWDLGVDSIMRTVNNVPDDALPDTENFRVDSNFPATYPTTSFKKQMSQAKEARRKANTQLAVGIAVSAAAAFATGGLSLTATAASGTTYLSTFSAGVISSGVSGAINEASMRGDISALRAEQKAMRAYIDRAASSSHSGSEDGFIFSNSAESDFSSPDSYLVSSKAYSGPLVLLRSEDVSEQEAFIPTSYLGLLDIDYGTGTDLINAKGYVKDYTNVMLTDSALRIITDVNVDGGEINGFEFVDSSGNHHIFDSVVEKFVSRNIAGFTPSQGDSSQQFAEFTWTNLYPGDYLGLGLPTNLYKDSDNDPYGTATYITDDYTTAWGISAITGASFQDVGPIGQVNAGDHGSWVKFNYCNMASPETDPDCPTEALVRPLSNGVFTQSNSQRTTVDSAYFGLNDDYSIDSNGNKFVSRNFKTYQFLSSIETYSHKVDFKVDLTLRNDGREAFEEGTSTPSNLDMRPKLDEIILSRRDIVTDPTTTNFIPLEKYTFEYDYSLAYGAPDNIKYAIGQCSEANKDECGRLTLKSLTHWTCNAWSGNTCTSWEDMPPIEFEYANNEVAFIEPVCVAAASASGNCGVFDSNCAGAPNTCEEDFDMDYDDDGYPIGSGAFCGGTYNVDSFCENIDSAIQCVFNEPYGCEISSSYENNIANPKYVKGANDRWGYYYISTDEDNIHNHQGKPNPTVDAWSLTKVKWPTGGTTEWKFEEDRYARMNDYYSDAVDSLGIEKEDTHYGGGLRVKKVINCDGLGQCYDQTYEYNTKAISALNGAESDGFNSGTISQSSGVATGEPVYPKYTSNGLFAKFSAENEDLYVRGGVPAVGYSRVLSYGNSPQQTGVTEALFTTPLYETTSGETLAAKGYYTPTTIFENFVSGDSDSKGSNPSTNFFPIGADFVIDEGIGNDDVNDLLIKEGETYLVQSTVPGYLFFFKSKTKTQSGGCSSAIYDPVCHNRAKVQQDIIPAIVAGTCPGGDPNTACGTIVLDDNGAPTNGNWGHDCSCLDQGNLVYFCTKDGVTSALGGDLEDSANWQSVVQSGLRFNNIEQESCGGGGSSCSDKIRWTFPWQNFCYHIYGGGSESGTSETWRFENTIDTKPCADSNDNDVCDLLENPISMNTRVPIHKYGLVYETNQYDGANLVGEPIASSYSTYNFDAVDPQDYEFDPENSEYSEIVSTDTNGFYEASFHRGETLAGTSYLLKQESYTDDFYSKIDTMDYDIDGVPRYTRVLSSDGELKTVETLFVKDYNMFYDRENYHILTAPKRTITYNGAATGIGNIEAASDTVYEVPGSRNAENLYLPKREFVWSDGCDPDMFSCQTGAIDDSYYDEEWQKLSEIEAYDNIFLRPVAVQDPYGHVDRTYFSNAGNGECNKVLGLFMTCVKNDNGNTMRTFYDDNAGRVTHITDANGESTLFRYDELGRLDETWLPGSHVNLVPIGTVPDVEYEYGFFNSVDLLNGGFEDGFNHWQTQHMEDAADYYEVVDNVYKGGTHSVHVVDGTGNNDFTGIRTELYKLEPNTKYVVSAWIYVPSGVTIDGTWSVSRHVYPAENGACDGNCHRYTILEDNSYFDDNIPRDQWVRKWAVIETWDEAVTGRILIIAGSGANKGRANFYVDNVGVGYPNIIKTKTRLDGTQIAEAISFSDGLGRGLQSQVKEASNSWIVSNSDYYDYSSIVEKAWKSVRENTQGVYFPTTSSNIFSTSVYEHSPLGRVLEVHPAEVVQ